MEFSQGHYSHWEESEFNFESSPHMFFLFWICHWNFVETSFSSK